MKTILGNPAEMIARGAPRVIQRDLVPEFGSESAVVARIVLEASRVQVEDTA
jgi:hypothetical protein